MDIDNQDSVNLCIKESEEIHNHSTLLEKKIDSGNIYNLIPFFVFESRPFNQNSIRLKENEINFNVNNIYNENFIKLIRFIPNNRELLLISNKNQIIINKIDIEKVLSFSSVKDVSDNINDEESEIDKKDVIFEENNFIYDVEILYDENSFTNEEYLKNIIICSKDNPIRILNGKKNNEISKTYIIRNQVEEIINPISLKINHTDLSLYAGGNKFVAKIDLVADKIEKFQLKNERNLNEKSVYSCFDFNINNQFYLTGTYSKKIFLVDTRTNTSFDTLVYHQNGINSLRFLQNQTNFISGARKDDYVHVWDLRNLKIPVASFYRNGETNQKLEIEIDKEEKFLFLANKDGTFLVYDLKNLNTQEYLCYFYENAFNEPVSSITYNRDFDILASSNGTRHFPNFIDKEEREIFDKSPNNKEFNEDRTENFIDDPFAPSCLKIWKFKYL